MKRRINYEKNYYNTNNLKQYFILIISCVCIRTKKEIIQLDNGYYLETIIEETPTTRASNQKTAKKTGNYKNAQGTTMFSVTVTGTFTYTGSSSTCTKSIASATSKNANWKISTKSASKSGNKATAKATAKRYVDGTAVETQNCTVTLTCSSNGSLS